MDSQGMAPANPESSRSILAPASSILRHRSFHIKQLRPWFERVRVRANTAGAFR